MKNFANCLSCLIVTIFSSFSLSAQTSVELPLHVWTAIQEGSASVTYSQFDIGSIGQVFDGDPGSLGRSAAVNPMVITLSFSNPVNVSNTAILTSHGSSGWWTLESADTQEDLDNQTGSYQLHVSQAPQFSDEWQTYTNDFTARLIRLSVKRTVGDDFVHLNEWQLTATTTIQASGLCFRPNGLRLIPGASFAMQAVLEDTAGLVYPLPAPAEWTSSNPGLFAVDGDGVVTAGPNTGAGILTASWNGLVKSTPVKVVEDFVLPKADPRVVKVALVVIDPPIAALGGVRFSEHFWDYEGGPHFLAQAMADSLTAFSEGVVQYEITHTYDAEKLFCTFGEVELTSDSLYQLFLEPDWATLHYVAEQLGQSHFDYNGLLAEYDFCTMSDAGEIDEVWVYSMPFLGTWESTLTGEGAFWYNSPPLTGNDCVGHLPIMGLNYERGRAEALHSYGHRAESAMAQVFGRWSYNTLPLNSWELFASYDHLIPGQAHLGNIHFPPNGTSDYDYVNPNEVITYAPNWRRYPFLFQETEIVSCETWNCDHLDHLSWWYRHFPHFRCKDQYNHLNNWWTYIVDYNEGKALEAATPGCDCDIFGDSSVYVQEPLERMNVDLFPNPVANQLQVTISIPGDQELTARVYNTLGQMLTETHWRIDQTQQQLFRIPFHGHPDGLYWLILVREDGRARSIPFVKDGN